MMVHVTLFPFLLAANYRTAVVLRFSGVSVYHFVLNTHSDPCYQCKPLWNSTIRNNKNIIWHIRPCY